MGIQSAIKLVGCHHKVGKCVADYALKQPNEINGTTGCRSVTCTKLALLKKTLKKETLQARKSVLKVRIIVYLLIFDQGSKT